MEPQMGSSNFTSQLLAVKILCLVVWMEPQLRFKGLSSVLIETSVGCADFYKAE